MVSDRKSMGHDHEWPRKGIKNRMMIACTTEIKVPEIVFPITMESFEIGQPAFLLNLNSRSNTIKMGEKINENNMIFRSSRGT